jgi:hypothetical protein
MSAVQRLSPIQSTVDREPASPRKNFVFVCGLHRSGTTLITRCLAQHPMISTFANTGSIEDEGQFLQTVLPLERTFGGVGRFGFDARAHMTETSELNTPDAASRLLSEWGRHWNMDKSVLLEKTPSNLLRMRLLARMFQPSAFVIVTRHPVATSLATLKWTEATAFSLISHWVHCYRIARSDAALLDRTLWLSYEAFVRRPQEELARLVQFLGLPPRSDWSLALRDDNEAYFELWRTRFFAESDRSIEQIPPERRRSLLVRARDRMERNRRERSLPAHLKRENLRNFREAQDAVALFEATVSEFGYSLIDTTRMPENGSGRSPAPYLGPQ